MNFPFPAKGFFCIVSETIRWLQVIKEINKGKFMNESKFEATKGRTLEWGTTKTVTKKRLQNEKEKMVDP